MKKILFLTFVISYLTKNAQISNTLTTQFLDKNRVKALITKTNDKFWDINGNGISYYEVPKGTGNNAQFANSLWIGGLDNNNMLHLSANTYKQNGTDYWSGPLDTTNINVFTPTLTAKYNRVWKIDCNDINAFVAAYNSGSVAANTYTIPEAILNFPAKESGNYMKYMEKFKDANNNGLYNPITEGDYPLIKGHQQILSIFNDNQSVHGETGALPMGLEIHEKSYSFYEPNIVDTMQAINYTTFFEYTIYNRSGNNYHDVFVSDWADVDLGYYLNDYIGTDTSNQFVYCYNGTKADSNYSPVISHALIDGCVGCVGDGIDNNNNGIIDELDEKFTISKTTYYNNNIGAYNPATTNPVSKWQYYNYMSGRWKDSTLFKYGGSAFTSSLTSGVTNCVYTGNPQTNQGWTESSGGNLPGDRRHLMSCGPFNLMSGQSFVFGYAIIYSKDTTTTNNSITQFNTLVKRDVKNIRYYQFTHLNSQCSPNAAMGIKEYEKKLAAIIYPNPTTKTVVVDLNQNAKGAKINLFNIMGQLLKQETINEGYRITLNVEDIPNGIYLIEINFENKRYFDKIIKE